MCILCVARGQLIALSWFSHVPVGVLCVMCVTYVEVTGHIGQDLIGLPSSHFVTS